MSHPYDPLLACLVIKDAAFEHGAGAGAGAAVPDGLFSHEVGGTERKSVG